MSSSSSLSNPKTSSFKRPTHKTKDLTHSSSKSQSHKSNDDDNDNDLSFLFPKDQNINQAPSSAQLPPTSDKQNLCINALVNGFVNSFVDFFYLTHRSDEEVANASRTVIPDTHLPQIIENLSEAEKAHRRADSETVFDAYEKLANYFRQNMDFKTAIYFYEKCKDIAESVQNLSQQGNSCLHLGLCHEAMNETSTAISFHEAHLLIANKLNDSQRVSSAHSQLVSSYRRSAEEYERKEDYVKAVEFYKKCVNSANACGDVRGEGVATFRLGFACIALGDRTASIEFQLRYLNLCKRVGDQVGEGAACHALASSYRDMGDRKTAISYLEKYHLIASRNKQTTATAEACAALGSIYSEQGDHVTAVSYFEKTFEIARSVGDRKLIDAARINLGMARGNMAMGKYMNVVKHDLPQLLNWKTRRAAVK